MASSHAIVSDPFTATLINIKARQLCRRSDFSPSDYDDLRQDMRLYLLEKASLFDPERGNLEAFVTNALKTWVAMRLRYRNRNKRRGSHRAVSLERTAVKCDGQITTLGTVLLEDDGQRLTRTDPITPAEQFELRDGIKHVMANLSPEDRALLISVTEHGARPTARALGVSWRQITNALARIREQFEKAGLGQIGRASCRERV